MSPRLTNATVVLTGATSGIGAATARLLAPQVGRLIIHGPEPAPPEDLGARYLSADYGRLDDVRALAAAIDGVDILINNAGRPGAPTRTLSEDGYELTLQTNYLAPYLLTNLLQPARTVNVASATHESATLDDLDLEHGYSPVRAYAQSKLALVTWTCALAAQLDGSRREVVSLHPGVIRTDLLAAMFGPGGDTPEHAAANIAALVATDGPVNGRYFHERREQSPNPIARDPQIQRRLLALSAERTRSGPSGPDRQVV